MEKMLMSDVKIINKAKGYFWFEARAMKFFRTRLGKVAYRKGDNAYFITSEQDEGFLSGKIYPRLYSIRIINLIAGNIDTIGDFQEFETHAQAKARLMLIIGKK